MKSYIEMSVAQLKEEREVVERRISEYKSMNLSLDMTRGKPSSEQLSISNCLFDNLETKTNFKASDGFDCRNYGVPLGIPEVRNLFAEILNTSSSKIFVGNSSSLNMMFDTLMRSLVFGQHDSDKPWIQINNRKWLCPVPGYDRHFRITEDLGFEMINISMNSDGPDIDQIEKLVSEDESILGIWCIPCYSNPDGIVYSNEVCERLASMKTKAKDFRIFWDNAYVVHHLYGDKDKQGSIPDILSLCEKYGNASRVFEFASTSKVTFAGAGIACMAANEENFEFSKKIMDAQTICSNKVNQLAHAVMLPDLDAVEVQMQKHAEILRPKFELSLDILSRELDETNVVNWHKPLGGYFISVFVYPNTADRVVKMCKDIGVAFTPAGATYPYGKDPSDSNIRIAPSFPVVDDIEKAVTVFALCAKLAAIDKILEERA